MATYKCNSCAGPMGHVATYFEPARQGGMWPFSRFKCMWCKRKVDAKAIYPAPRAVATLKLQKTAKRAPAKTSNFHRNPIKPKWAKKSEIVPRGTITKFRSLTLNEAVVNVWQRTIEGIKLWITWVRRKI